VLAEAQPSSFFSLKYTGLVYFRLERFISGLPGRQPVGFRITRILHETCSKLSNSDFGIRKIDWRGNVFDQSIKNSI
jgi:hypothetical protein